MMFLPRFVHRIAVALPVVGPFARVVAERLPLTSLLLPDEQHQHLTTYDAGVVVNITLYSPGTPVGAAGHEETEDCGGPWWGLEGYDTA